MLNIDRAFLKTLVVIKSFLIEDHLFNDRVFSCNLKYCLHGSHVDYFNHITDSFIYIK